MVQVHRTSWVVVAEHGRCRRRAAAVHCVVLRELLLQVVHRAQAGGEDCCRAVLCCAYLC